VLAHTCDVSRQGRVLLRKEAPCARDEDDEPGVWWLITNRSLAKRPVFEMEQDVERILGFLGEAVARGEIEVRAFTIMSTEVWTA
jgi:hypothetical protein